jgi:hypothetical protein
MQPARSRFSFPEYVRLEERSPIKHEFLDAQDRPRLELWRREPDGGWALLVSHAGETLTLATVPAKLAVDELYRGLMQGVTRRPASMHQTMRALGCGLGSCKAPGDANTGVHRARIVRDGLRLSQARCGESPAGRFRSQRRHL